MQATHFLESRILRYGGGLLIGSAIALALRPVVLGSPPGRADEGVRFILPAEMPIHDLLLTLSEGLRRGETDAATVVDATVSILGCLKPEDGVLKDEGWFEIPVVSEGIRYGQMSLTPRDPNGVRMVVIELAIESSPEFQRYSLETDLSISCAEGPRQLSGLLAVAESHVHRREEIRRELQGQGPVVVGGAYSINAEGARWFPIVLEVQEGPDGDASWHTRSGTEEPRELVALADAGADYVAQILRTL